MNKQLYIIDYESCRICGGQSHCVVWAENEDDAVILASDHMEDEMRELFSDHYEDEDIDPDAEGAVTVNSVEILDENNEHWEFFQDPNQSSFYPVIGEPSV